MAIETLSKESQTLAPNGIWAEIYLERILHNLQEIREKAGSGVQVMAVVKANAYGHGMVPVSKALQGKVDFLGIASLKEAFLLRAEGVTTPLLVFGHVFPEEIPVALQKKLILTVSSLEEATTLSEVSQQFQRKASVHVKVDTGMGRLGIPYHRAFAEITAMAGLPGLQLEGIYTHFPTAEKFPDEFTQKQLANFEKLIADLEAKKITFAYRHAANSAGALRIKSSRLNLIRPGLALYGLYPDPSLEPQITLQPALYLKTKIVLLKHLLPGDSVGYGREFIASGPTTIAVLPAGYSHGYPFQLSGKGEVIYRGKRFRIAGRVCMDAMMIDLGLTTQARVGDEVILIGSHGDERIRAEELAALAQTIPYEIVTRLDPGLPRFYH